jgi:hypothetical protein
MMMTNTHVGRGILLGALALTALQGCGGDLALPSQSGDGVDLSIVDGNEQIGTVGQELPAPLVVSVKVAETPIPDHEVAFLVTGDPAAGRLEPDTAVTDENGEAVTHWVLGSKPGPHQVEAVLVVSDPAPPPSAVFEASAVADEPDTLRAASPESQPGRLGRPVAEPPVVLVLDRFGNPVSGVDLDWDVTAGGGSVSDPTPTGPDGKATVTWTLGLGIGVQKLTAAVSGVHGSPVTFTATVLF